MDKCILEIKEYGTYWMFVVSDESGFVQFRRPGWAKRVAESVSKDALVTVGMRADGSWDVQSIEIKKIGKSRDKARELAIEIATKLRACNA